MLGKFIEELGRCYQSGICFASGMILALALMVDNIEAAEEIEGPGSLVELEARIDTIMKRDDLPGAVAAIVENGRLVWSRGFGLAGLITSWRTSLPIAGPLARSYSAFVTGALLILATYMARYGWPGMQTWNY
jgi:hypothetical protein